MIQGCLSVHFAFFIQCTILNLCCKLTVEHGKGVCFRIENVLVQWDNTRVTEEQIEILECLCQPECLHLVSLFWWLEPMDTINTFKGM